MKRSNESLAEFAVSFSSSGLERDLAEELLAAREVIAAADVVLVCPHPGMSCGCRDAYRAARAKLDAL